VTDSLLGVGKRTAVFRPGLGATLAAGVRPEVLASSPSASSPAGCGAHASPLIGGWPDGEPTAVGHQGLFADAFAVAFAEPNPTRLRRTRAVVPSLRVIAVRLGMSIFMDAWDHASFLAALVRAAR